jgi:DNA ligase 1
LKLFAELCKAIEDSTAIDAKMEVLFEYMRVADPADCIWAISLLSGKKPKQVVPIKKLREWAAELSNVPDWLFEECQSNVGDLAETITLLLPQSDNSTEVKLHVLIENVLADLRKMDETNQKQSVIDVWMLMNNSERFVWNKLITGSFRPVVQANIIIKAISLFSGVNEQAISHRITGDWEPSLGFFLFLISNDTKDADKSIPYPFCSVGEIEEGFEKIVDINEWQAEWKWDGIRAQIIKRDDEVFIRSFDGDLITLCLPELNEAGKYLPDGIVIEGEIIPWKDNKPMPFAELQKRLGRKKLTKKIIEEIPAAVIVYDLLEFNSTDIHSKKLSERRVLLENVIANCRDKRIILSPIIYESSWNALKLLKEESRSRMAEGLILKRKDSHYELDSTKSNWLKWKTNPLTVEAVLLYAQQGSGRSTLFTDYTFAVWKDNQLIPFAKASTGLSEIEILKIDDYIRKNTVEKFGPVRTVKPELVFGISFEAIQLSSRHKSGITVKFPRIAGWLHGKTINEADSLETLIKMVKNG